MSVDALPTLLTPFEYQYKYEMYKRNNFSLSLTYMYGWDQMGFINKGVGHFLNGKPGCKAELAHTYTSPSCFGLFLLSKSHEWGQVVSFLLTTNFQRIGES